MDNVQFENSSLFLHAFRNAPIGMAIVATDGRWLKVNPSLCEIVGFTEEELLNTSFQAMTHPDDLPRDESYVQRVLAGEFDKYQLEKRYIHKYGHWIWILLSVSLVRNDRNEPEFFISQIQDISERKHADRRLQESEQRYKSLFEYNPAFVYSLDLDGKFTSANPNAEQLIGYRQEDLLGRSYEPLMYQEDLEKTKYHIEQAKKGIPQKYDAAIHHKNGQVVEIRVQNVPIIVDDENVGVFGIAEDITEHKRHLEQIEKLSYQNSLILNSVAEGIYGLDLNKKIMFCNPAASKLLGYSIEELLGKSPAETFRHHIPISPEEYYRQLAEKNVHIITGESFYRKDGSSFPVEYTTTPILDKGKIAGAVVNFTDISERLQTEQLMEQQEQLDLELSLAAGVQESLLPRLQPTDYPDKTEIGVLSIPARTLNGDFYNFASKDDNFLMGVADISGKGIPAAILMSMMKFAMDATLQNSHMPDAVLHLLNRFVDKYSNLSTFVTMFIGSYNKRNGNFYYANAGHEPAILYRAKTGTFEDLVTHGPVLGLFHEYVYQTHHVALQPGDMILMYTDGVIENRICKEADTNAILKQLLKQMDYSQSPQEIVEQMLQSIRENNGGKAADDQTLLLFRREE